MQDSIMSFVPGQRWVSLAEPELGLGVVLSVEFRRVTLLFQANGEQRMYATAAEVPLTRVRYVEGDVVGDGEVSFVVERVEESDGLLTYCGKNSRLPESFLCAQSAFNRPQDRLLNEQVDAGALFALRLRVHEAVRAYYALPVRGLIGGRVDLIPHQLYVVESVVQRASPRVLLSDEIGLGKTIEACLVLHRKLMLGQVNRALILVPGALIHQWFVELLRRFALKVAIYDDERCCAIEENADSGNPFLDDQLVLCDVEWLANDPGRGLLAVQAGWDLLIVDEAHHLEWTPERISPEYGLVEELAKCSRGILLLTATPEETGGAGHFARLRLLDPERYTSPEEFEAEVSGYDDLVPLAEALENEEVLTVPQRQQLIELGLDPAQDRSKVLASLIDCYGPGRVIFRNTRRIIRGFPVRHVHLVPLERSDNAVVDWLIDLLDGLAPEKVFAIIHSCDDALRIYDCLRERTGMSVAAFHEDMNLLQRDRQAAWFADPGGARVLIASEIGGEGRNFQFAHHLVFLDVPANPEVVEQRIGRLDRIGQRKDIHIHVPFVVGSVDQVNAVWLHDGLDAFRKPVVGAHILYAHFLQELETKEGAQVGKPAWRAFISETNRESSRIMDRMVHGRDRLLQLHSYRADTAMQWVDAIRAVDGSRHLEQLLLDIFEAYGVHPELMDNRCWLLKPDPVFSDCFPGFPREGMMITFDRTLALSREDIGFVSWDHPLVHGAIERVLSSVQGNTSQAVWCSTVETRYLLDAVFVLETAGATLQASCCLPATPIRVLVDDKSKLWTDAIPPEQDLIDLVSQGEQERALIKLAIQRLIKKALRGAEEQAALLRENAKSQIVADGDVELRRMRVLQQQNGQISDDEILQYAAQMQEALTSIENAPVRLDAIRWIWCRKR